MSNVEKTRHSAEGPGSNYLFQTGDTYKFPLKVSVISFTVFLADILIKGNAEEKRKKNMEMHYQIKNKLKLRINDKGN